MSAEATLAIAPSNGRGLQLTSLDDMMRFAQIVVSSGLAPSSFQTAEQVVIAVITGLELGISAMQSLQGLAVTNGRIGIMGDLALALCEASPECEDVIEEWSGQPMADDWTCRITVKRKGREPRTGSFSVREAGGEGVVCAYALLRAQGPVRLKAARKLAIYSAPPCDGRPRRAGRGELLRSKGLRRYGAQKREKFLTYFERALPCA